MASLAPSASASARFVAPIASHANDGAGRVASRVPAPSSRRMTGRRTLAGRSVLSRDRPLGAFASPRRRSGLSGTVDDRRWRRFSHPTEPTGAERAARVVPAAKTPAREDGKKHEHATGTKTTPRKSPRSTGLEAGLWKVFSQKTEKSEDGSNGTKMDSAKKLLKKYGSAYLVTSISLSIVSISLCYALISAGVDVPGLLDRVGLTVTSTSEKFGTFALAYAAHKAMSPIRFPPTVALTPVVAGWLGKKPVEDGNETETAE
jgi:hypothetical protein